MCAFTSVWWECESASRGLMTSDKRTPSGLGFYKSLSPEHVRFLDTFWLTCDLVFHLPYLTNSQYCICHRSHRFLSKVPPHSLPFLYSSFIPINPVTTFPPSPSRSSNFSAISFPNNSDLNHSPVPSTYLMPLVFSALGFSLMHLVCPEPPPPFQCVSQIEPTIESSINPMVLQTLEALHSMT